jgi:hypothetical protein
MIASQKKLTHINASKRIIEIIKEDIKWHL